MRRLLCSVPALALTAGIALAEGKPGQHFFDNWDGNEDGAMTLEEAREKRGDIFVMFDHDENGILDPAEYDEFDAVRAGDLESQGMGKGPKHHPANLMFREMNDGDGDGSVTLQEFLGGTDAWFAKIDRDGDGAVTTADFGPPKS